MNDLPRREPTPLYPSAGRFEETLRRARLRRRRSAMVASAALVVVCAGGITGAVALRGGHVTQNAADPGTSAPSFGQPGSESNASGPVGATSPSESRPDRPSSSGSEHHPSGSGSGHSTAPSAGSSGPPSSVVGGKLYHGRAIDAAGKPLANVGVYVKSGGGLQRVATTDANGAFAITPTNSPVLLAGGDFAGSGSPTSQNYAYTYVDATDASSSGTPAATTVMNTGGKLAVTVTDANGHPLGGSTMPALYCDATATTPCYSMSADSSGQYVFTGLPTGDYTLRGAYASKTYHVTAGETTNVSWVEGQAAPPPPSDSPTPPPPTSDPTTEAPSSDTPDTAATQNDTGTHDSTVQSP